MNKEELLGLFGVEKASQLRMIFCKIPWMKCYLGESGDEVLESDLFYPGIADDPSCLVAMISPGERKNPFGYVEQLQLDLESHFKGQLETFETNQYVEDVLVVWVAQTPECETKKSDTVIVGWWKYAMVLRDFDELSSDDGMEKQLYNVMASSEDAFLLDVDQRNFSVKNGEPKMLESLYGKVWYADAPEELSFRESVVAYILKCEKEDLNHLQDYYAEYEVEDFE